MCIGANNQGESGTLCEVRGVILISVEPTRHPVNIRSMLPIQFPAGWFHLSYCDILLLFIFKIIGEVEVFPFCEGFLFPFNVDQQGVQVIFMERFEDYLISFKVTRNIDFGWIEEFRHIDVGWSCEVHIRIADCDVVVRNNSLRDICIKGGYDSRSIGYGCRNHKEINVDSLGPLHL